VMAVLASFRGTCSRRKVGCVLADQRNRILATGYNGVASGLPHCIDHPCPGANLPSGTGLNLCQAIHAEANALISCRNPEDIYTCYSTASPCEQCIRFLLNTSCKRIVFAEIYPHIESERLWASQGREWVHIEKEKVWT
jgi:dCMP deaminase